MQRTSSARLSGGDRGAWLAHRGSRCPAIPAPRDRSRPRVDSFLMAERTRSHPLLRYTLLQVPDVALAALVVWALWNWLLIPGWVALVGLAVWIAKDIAIYPLVRRSFSLGESEWVGVRPLIGARGVATEDLSPSGWVRVKGELWQARASEDAPVPGGSHVRVREVRGMTLLIESDQGPTRLKQSAAADVEPADGDDRAADQGPGGDEVRHRQVDARPTRRPLG